jgi:hypothetical protein
MSPDMPVEYVREQVEHCVDTLPREELVDLFLQVRSEAVAALNENATLMRRNAELMQHCVELLGDA